MKFDYCVWLLAGVINRQDIKIKAYIVSFQAFICLLYVPLSFLSNQGLKIILNRSFVSTFRGIGVTLIQMETFHFSACLRNFPLQFIYNSVQF